MTWRLRFLAIAIAAVGCTAAPHALAAESCDPLAPCAAKACRLDAEIAQAKAKGNAKQVAALEHTRAENTHCSDDGLKQKREVALAQAQRRIDQRAADLEKAQSTGNAAKIDKAQRKLDSARKAFSDLQKAPL